MSISNEITRLQTIRNAIRTKLIALGIVTDASANFEDCQNAIENIANHGTIAVKLDTETTTLTVEEGFYKNGSVSIEPQEKTVVANGEITPDSGKVLSKVIVAVENAPTLQEKIVTPTKSVQDIIPDSGYDGLSKVSVGAIPDAYQNVADVTAIAPDVLANKIIVTADGTVTAGTMANNGSVSANIDGLNIMSYVIPQGYHSGNGTVTLTNDIENALAAL